MERIFNILLSAPPNRVLADKRLRKLYKRLVRYYTGGKWLADYTLDEKGGLPPSLKRGVLSQDGVYDLLSAVETVDNNK